jgi:hypothetical protein
MNGRGFVIWIGFVVCVILGVLGLGVWGFIEVVNWLTSK